MGVFLLLSSLIFYSTNLQARSSDLPVFIGMMSYLWMLLCPVLTMRLLAEERQKRTDQLLLTSPVSLPGIVLGKYFAAVTVMLATVALTLVFALLVAVYGKVYPQELAVCYLGFILQGCAFIALDLFLSGCVSSPVTAAVLAFGGNFLLWILDVLEVAITTLTQGSTLLARSGNMLRELLAFFSLYARGESFLIGQLSFADIGYFISFTAAFIAMTIHSLDSRRYRGA